MSDLLTDESMLSLEIEQDIMKDSGTSSCVTNQLRHGRVVATKSGIPRKVLLKTSLSCGSFCSQIPGKQTFTTRSTNHHKEIVPEYSLCRIRCSQERYRLRFTSVGTGLNFTCTVYQTVGRETTRFKTDSRQLSTVSTDAALLANNSQHCWMLLVASVCTPGRMLLRKV